MLFPPVLVFVTFSMYCYIWTLFFKEDFPCFLMDTATSGPTSPANELTIMKPIFSVNII